MEIVCENKLCGKVFDYKWGQSHFKRCKAHYCSISCKDTTHGLAGTKRHKMWAGAKKRAWIKGIPFSLVMSDMPEIPEVCPILSIKLKENCIAGPDDCSPSLDRIIPELGYVAGNVRVISNRANRIRSDANAHELMLIARDAARIESL